LSTARFLAVSIALALLALALAPLHTLSALLSLPLAIALGHVVCDLLSHAIAGRPFVFPSKWGLNTEEERRILAWSDHALAFLLTLLAVLGLFAFGEAVDCMRGEDVWKGAIAGIDWCAPR
jgi:hypothetical protein